jgi:hypothetical protein
MSLHFVCPSKFPIQASIPRGPPNTPSNVGPTIFFLFPTQPPIVSLPRGGTVTSAVVRCLQASPPPSPLFPPLPLRPPSALPSARHPLPCIRGCTGSGRKCWRAGCGGHGGPRPSLFRRSLPRGVLPWLTPAATDHCAYAAVRI